MQLDERANFSNSKSALSKDFRLALLDLDGVVYRGGKSVEYAAESIEDAQKKWHVY